MQDQAEANRGRLRGIEKMLRKFKQREQKIEERSAGIKGTKKWAIIVVTALSTCEGRHSYKVSFMRGKHHDWSEKLVAVFDMVHERASNFN